MNNSAEHDIVEDAIQVLNELNKSNYPDGVFSSKAIETGLRLAAQLCVSRLSRKLTITDIARKLDLKTSTVIYWRDGKATPKLDSFKKLVSLYRQECRDEYNASFRQGRGRPAPAPHRM